MKQEIFPEGDYALALSGGGCRGAAHAGILLALSEENRLPSAIAGTSAGSIVAGLFASGMHPAEICEMVHTLAKHGTDYLDPAIGAVFGFVPRLLLGRPTKLCGLLKGKKLHCLFKSWVGERVMSELAYPLLIPAVDLRTGYTVVFTSFPVCTEACLTGSAGGNQKIRWMDRGRFADVMMASSSVPGVFCPFHMEEMELVDGGVTNNLPVDLLHDAGFAKVAAVDVGAGYEGEICNSVFDILSHSFSIMSENLKDCRSEGEEILLRPPLPTEAGLLTFNQMEACMESAYHYMKNILTK